MSLTLRQNLNRKLTIQEMDSNLEYLEQLAQSGSTPDFLTDGEIEVDLFNLIGLNSEETDFSKSLQLTTTVKFAGIKKDVILNNDNTPELNDELEEGEETIEIITTTLSGMINLNDIFKIAIGDVDEEEFESLPPYYVNIQYSIFTKRIDNVIKNTVMNVYLNGSVNELLPYLIFNYQFNNIDGHYLRISFSPTADSNQDNDEIAKFKIDIEGNFDEPTLNIIYSNLPTSDEELSPGQIWNDDGTIKIKL
jgi:hypothetical protein